ncbi:hypothetical protein BG003_011702, partial [Podila horticola]
LADGVSSPRVAVQSLCEHTPALQACSHDRKCHCPEFEIDELEIGTMPAVMQGLEVIAV